MADLYIITGASKGIGEALATQLENAGHDVLRLARTNPHQLPNLQEVDLTNISSAIIIIENWINNRLSNATSINLINNAGTVEPMGIVGKMDITEISQALMLNVGAVIALSNAFVALTNNFAGRKTIMNISSGAGRKPYEGWGVYCATKAAVDRFTEVLMQEQSNQINPIKVTAIAPGIIETDMQNVIRNSTEELFPNIERFIDYKNTGKLSSANDTATALLNYLHSEKMGSSAITDIRD